MPSREKLIEKKNIWYYLIIALHSQAGVILFSGGWLMCCGLIHI